MFLRHDDLLGKDGVLSRKLVDSVMHHLFLRLPLIRYKTYLLLPLLHNERFFELITRLKPSHQVRPRSLT